MSGYSIFSFCGFGFQTLEYDDIVIELEGGEEVDLLEAGSSSYPNSNDKE